MKIRIFLAAVGLGVSAGVHTSRPFPHFDVRENEAAKPEATEFELNKSAFCVDAPLDFSMLTTGNEIPPAGWPGNTSSNSAPTPEPATIATLTVGSGLLLYRRKRRNRK